ncbi:Dbl homology domain-containing protein [Blakeslea trispora]|nr:Dbl homology domain-containing protein [Blakeslea trispora]
MRCSVKHKDNPQKKTGVCSAASKLSIDTSPASLSKKKNPLQQLFSPREKSLSETISKSNKKQHSLPTPPSSKDDPTLHDTCKSAFIDNGCSNNAGKIADENHSHRSIERPKSSHCRKSSGNQVLKKIHVPHFSKKANVQSSAIMDYFPVLPEPIMPTIINWSSEIPVSPPPWELEGYDSKIQQTKSNYKRHTTYVDHSPVFTQEPKTYEDHESFSTIGSHSDSDLFDHHTESSAGSIAQESSDYALSTTSSRSSMDPVPRLQRRSSCPDFEQIAYSSTSSDSLSSSSTLVEKDIIHITELHTRDITLLRKNQHLTERRSPFKPCQKTKKRTSYGEAMMAHSYFFDNLCEDTLKYLYIPNLFDPVTREPIVEFATIEPRKYQLYRKTNWKREAKAMLAWRHSLEERLLQPLPLQTAPAYMPPNKAERNLLTRKFILREFFMTEVNFWNQLYYTKIVFYDSLCFAIDNGSLYAKPSHSDIFANLFDLMRFSAKLINRLRHLRVRNVKEFDPFPMSDKDIQQNAEGADCNSLYLGKILLDMAEDFVVFLRCAVDYRDNKKQLDMTSKNEGFLHFQQKLNSIKSGNRFGLRDYLIIPVQRAARYGLLLADILKHTDSTHPDYAYLVKSYHLVTSLTYAMDSAQKKSL